METKTITNSSQVIEIGYDKESKVFYVTYKNGGKYAYDNVEADLWEKAQTAESTGKFVAAYIKNHSFRKLV